ncbi:2-phosphosulfolactate phosphatase [Rikenella microfusus]|uniref:2-phosphosulfolactate phosphatase n=1 Tax=Rikenella microfusus TaxID=28139 RepID=UPI00248D6EBF|nr:2-phosphosulfolactate phosphatase [Rikenella microfusus]
MEVDIIGTAGEVTDERVAGKNVAVIDVFRATSVMVTAFANGAREIIPMTGIEESFRLRDEIVARHRQSGDNGPVLLGGERKTVIIEGFDLDNSPLRYSPDIVRDATIVMSTTNGTRAVNCARGAAEIYVAALLNADAVARRLGERGEDIVLVCSGRHDRFTIEDALCAGMMARYLGRHYGYKLTDIAWWCADVYRRYEDDLQQALDHCEHYHNIKGRWAEDIAWCLRRNVTDVAPHIVKEGGIRL